MAFWIPGVFQEKKTSLLSFPLLTSILYANYSLGENEMSAIDGDFYIFLDNRAKENICMRKKPGDSKVGMSCGAIDRLWGSTRRCRDSLEGVNQS